MDTECVKRCLAAVVIIEILDGDKELYQRGKTVDLLNISYIWH